MIYVHRYRVQSDIRNFSRRELNKNLAHYLSRDISEIKISYNQNGKPVCEGLFFSVSHSKEVLVQVFSDSADIGVDVEIMNSQKPWLKLAKRYFHSCEYSQLKSMTEKEAVSLFFTLWTAKEAVCKAHGGRLWYFLADNYLNSKQLLVNSHNKCFLQNYIHNNYSLTIASMSPLQEVVFIK